MVRELRTPAGTRVAARTLALPMEEREVSRLPFRELDEELSPEARPVFDDIRVSRKSDYFNTPVPSGGTRPAKA